jgi:nitrilase
MSSLLLRWAAGSCSGAEISGWPLEHETGLLTAQIDLAELPRARYDFDVVGHYARPDVFSLHVDERAKQGVVFGGD